MIQLYDFHESGNCYKVRLLLTLLGIPFERVPVDILQGETRHDAFLEKNPNHRVPLVEWPDGRRLAESNAILYFFAGGSRFLPEDRWLRAQILQWMFFEQYSHEPYIAVARFWTFAGLLEENQDALSAKMDGGYHALAVMEDHLERSQYFAGEHYSIADIALYAYTHVAGEGGFDLKSYPAVRQWLERVASEPGHMSIED